MMPYSLDPELERALDRWIEQLREPPATRAEALTWALRDFLMGQGVIPYDEDSECCSEELEREKEWTEKIEKERQWRLEYEKYTLDKIKNSSIEIEQSKQKMKKRLYKISAFAFPISAISYFILPSIISSFVFMIFVLWYIIAVEDHRTKENQIRLFLQSFTDRNHYPN